MKAIDLLAELQSFTSVSESTIARALNSDLDSKNSSEFRELNQEWSNGDYDEDPELLVQRIERLL